MNSKQIEAFLMVVEKKSFTKAAKALHSSQSNISKLIMALEAELDISLFDKKGNTIQLTKPGVMVFEQLSCTFRELEELKRSLVKHQKESQVFTIGISASMSYAGLLQPIDEFQKKYPDVCLRFTESFSNELPEQLDSREIDVAIGWETEKIDFYEKYTLYKDSWKLLVSTENPLARYDIIDLSVARNEKFIIQANDRKLILACKKSGFKPNIVHNVSSILTLTSLVSNNYGVGFLCSKMIPSGIHNSIKAIPLQNRIREDIILFARNEKHPDYFEYFINSYQTRFHELYGSAASSDR